MQVFDQLTTQLNTMSRELKSLPALSACAEAGVAVPASGRFASMDELDMALTDAFGTLDLNTLDGKRSWEAKVRKGEILSSGLVAEPERKPDEAAVRYFANLMRQHKLEFDAKYMLTIPQLDRLMASAKLDPGTRLTPAVLELLESYRRRSVGEIPSRTAVINEVLERALPAECGAAHE